MSKNNNKNHKTASEGFAPGTYDGVQAAQDGAVDQHLADLDVDGQAGQVVAQRREGVVRGVTRPHLPQQADGVADRLGLRGVQRAHQEVLRRAVVALLRGGTGWWWACKGLWVKCLQWMFVYIEWSTGNPFTLGDIVENHLHNVVWWIDLYVT